MRGHIGDRPDTDAKGVSVTASVRSEHTPPDNVVAHDDKVPVDRNRLLALAEKFAETGRPATANLIRSGCLWQGDQVMVSRELAEKWGLTNE